MPLGRTFQTHGATKGSEKGGVLKALPAVNHHQSILLLLPKRPSTCSLQAKLKKMGRILAMTDLHCIRRTVEQQNMTGRLQK